MKLLYQGEMKPGMTSLHRAEAFERAGVQVIKLHNGAEFGSHASLYQRACWKLRWPVDVLDQNKTLLDAAEKHRPDVVLIDNSKVIRRKTLAELRRIGVRRLAYYSPDDVFGRHNLSFPLKASFPEWDVFFTTKTFNVRELEAAGARNVRLIGNAYDPALHGPISAEEIGNEYERFDLVFVGAHEYARRNSVNALAEAGMSVVVYGGPELGWKRSLLHANVMLRGACFGPAYPIALHHGKIGLCFLRKLNRDRITTRTIETAAVGRPMLGEKTDEHDAHFVDGYEYVGFSDDSELILKARAMLADSAWRGSIAMAALERCRRSGYSTDARAREMLDAIWNALESPVHASDANDLAYAWRE